MILLRPQCGDDADDRVGRPDAELAANRCHIGQRGESPRVDAVGNHGHFAPSNSQVLRPGTRPCDSATAMKASVIGVSIRLSRPTPSGQPVLCSAERTTGTPTRRAASRPQNILSPAPTVMTASISRCRNRLVSRGQTRRSYLLRQQVVVDRNLVGQRFAQRAALLQTAQFRCESLAVQPPDDFAVNISAPPTRMSVCMNITRSGRPARVPLLAALREMSRPNTALLAVAGSPVVERQAVPRHPPSSHCIFKSHELAPLVPRTATNNAFQLRK